MKYLDTDVISIRELKELVKKLDKNNNRDVYNKSQKKANSFRGWMNFV